MKKRYALVALTVILAALLLAACSDGECKHDFGKWTITKEANCAGPGMQSRQCDDCGYTQTEQIPALSGHTRVTVPAVAPTCTQTGLTEGAKCAVCGEILTAQSTVEKTGHSYTETVQQEPSCCADGIVLFRCVHCGDSYTENLPMPSYSAVEIHDLTEASVGEVLTYDARGNGLGLGTCFVYTSDGKVITNYHVIEGAYYAQVTINGATYDVTHVLAYSPEYDLAVLQIDATGLTVIPICTELHAAGETVYAFGSSQGMTATFSQGIITNADRNVDGVHHVQHDAAISPGNSGGPLINRFGEVIGINTWTRIDSQNLNFAVSVTELAKLDFSLSAMTLAQVAQLEHSATNVLQIMQDYILTNGSFYEEDNEYSVLMDPVADESGNQYISYYNYDLTYGEIELCLTINWEMFLYIYMDSEGIYGWAYWDAYEDIYGYYSFDDFAEGKLLPYDDYTLSDSESVEVLCSWASFMADQLCDWLDYDLQPMGLTAEDLGLNNY